MKQADSKTDIILAALGAPVVVWLALLIAPHLGIGLMGIINGLTAALDAPLNITICEDSAKTVLVFLLAYAMGVGIYMSSRKNYRRREEHGSAKWGNAAAINKRYKDPNPASAKILTQNVRLGMDGRRHKRNLNVLVVGGSGAGKTRFFGKPNVMGRP